MSEQDTVKKMVRFLDDKKGGDIRVLDLQEISSVADMFILVTCTSIPHLKALFEGLHRLLKSEDGEAVCKTGIAESGWMILKSKASLIASEKSTPRPQTSTLGGPIEIIVEKEILAGEVTTSLQLKS